MSSSNFPPNQPVYIHPIGYATVVASNGAQPTAELLPVLVHKQSMHFDPSLFNAAQQPNANQPLPKNEEKNPSSNVSTEKQAPSQQKRQKPQDALENSAPLIIKAKLDGTTAFVYTPEYNLSKSVQISVKSLLPNRKQRILITIEISKTIDSLKKAILDQMGVPLGNYYNIKLFVTAPRMGELVNPTKTIYQYRITHNHMLILTADYAFGFKSLPQDINCKYKIAINNNTLTSCIKPPPEPPLPAVLPPVTAQQTEGPKVDQTREQKPEVKDWQIVPALPGQPQRELAVIEHSAFLALCDIELQSGRRYWEIKVDRPPAKQGEILVGVCVPSKNAELRNCLAGCSHLWAYFGNSGRKGYEAYDDQGILTEEWQEQCGYAVTPNTQIGILAILRGKKASILFYFNNICCGQAFEIDLALLQGRSLVPFINISGQAQVSLDARAAPPLDSYRIL